ncbi:MAG: hypothetical protein OXH82_06750 [Candidatus Dadabacteria bacterium]|nr:hypothetical protein [Candidatus Dadabacteria bacterium]MDE0663604.1 hypothetical protein [Candidatus Dadabacteria bacterium]
MDSLPEYLERGEKARLFPVLADTSKEGRSTSILLSCLVHVRGFGQAMLGSVNQRVGKLASLTAYTEVTFADRGEEKAHRPDGLIVLRVDRRRWKALVETKIGNVKLDEEQLAAYMRLAREHNIDAVITVSNQFTSRPDHHPVKLSAKTRSRVKIYHWSWMYIITQADLLISNDDIEDEDQYFVLSEMLRFLTHASTGVKAFDRMPEAWPGIVQKIAAGASLQTKSEEVQDIVGAWHQEVRDISLLLTRKVNVKVEVRLPRSHVLDPAARAKKDAYELAEEQTLSAGLKIQDAAAPIELVVDIGKRTISASMTLEAPGNRKTTPARLNWLLRQLRKTSETDIHIRLIWPGRRPRTQYTLGELRENSVMASTSGQDLPVARFEVCMIHQLGRRFSQRKSFIDELEQMVSGFYETAGQYLRAYQPPAPKVSEDGTAPQSVTPEGLQRTEE